MLSIFCLSASSVFANNEHSIQATQVGNHVQIFATYLCTSQDNLDNNNLSCNAWIERNGLIIHDFSEQDNGINKSTYMDSTAIDTTPPDPVSGLNVLVSNGYPRITWNPATDQGTTYAYTIQTTNASSQTSSVTIPPSGIKEYWVVVDTNPSTIPNLKNAFKTSNTSLLWQHQMTSRFYVHVTAVDNRENISHISHHQMDMSPPTIDLNPSGWTNSAHVTVTINDTVIDSADNTIEYSRDGGENWYTYSEPFTVSDEGETTIFARTQDRAENTSSPASRTVQIDRTLPNRPTLQLNPPGWIHPDPVTVTLNGDPGDTITYSCNGGETWQTYSKPFIVSDEGKTIILAQTQDRAGNVSPSVSRMVQIDRTSSDPIQIDKIQPNPPTIHLNPSGWTHSEHVTVTIAGATHDDADDIIEYSRDDGVNWYTYSEPFTVSDEGKTNIFARTRNRAGTTSHSVSRTVRIDRTAPNAPTIDLSSAGWTKSEQVTVTLNGAASDDANSTIEYSLDRGKNWRNYSGPFTVSDEGETTIFARTQDRAKNTSSVISRTVQIDRTAPSEPTIDLSSAGWIHSEHVTVTINGTAGNDADNTIEYSLDGGKKWRNYSGPFTVSDEGETTISVQTRDRAGNTSRLVSRIVQINNRSDNSIAKTPTNSGPTPYSRPNTGNSGSTPYSKPNTGNSGPTPYSGTNTGNSGSTTPYSGTNTGNSGSNPYSGTNTGNNGSNPYSGTNTGNSGWSYRQCTNQIQPTYFKDIDKTWNKEEIKSLAAQGIIKGVSSNKFEPSRPITRAEYVVLTVRAICLTSQKPTKFPFIDVKQNDRCATEIATAFQHGIIDGMGANIFAPNKWITREQAAKTLAKMLQLIQAHTPKISKRFVDQDKISRWANQAVQLASNMFKGYPDNTFRPRNSLNRAQAAALIFRFKKEQSRSQLNL